MYNNPIYKFLKRQFKHVIHTIGFDVLSYNIFTSQDIQLQTLLRTYNINTVLDVGANEGQYANHLIELGYKGSIYSFEPMAAVYTTLRAKANRHPQWRTTNAGIGKEEGELMLNVSENLASSSLLKVEMNSVEVDPATRTTHQESIKITTI
ncbi:MAG TPA: FkbM family methyltransferase, partial [Chryseolinea sp.]|nr:FkbM family methyltransferase [Chryseolinea sp.]